MLKTLFSSDMTKDTGVSLKGFHQSDWEQFEIQK